MPNRVRPETIKIRNQTLSDLKRIYATEWNEIGEDVKRLVEQIYLVPEESTQAKRLKHADKNGKDKLIALLVGAAILANTKGIKRINSGMGKIYTVNANDVVSYVKQSTGIEIAAKGVDVNLVLGKFTKRRYNQATDSKYILRQVVREIKRMLKEGKSIDEIIERLKMLYYFNLTSAIRTTMTETTRIQSLGRNDVMLAALLLGIRFKKIWRHSHYIKAPRDWHVRMDGEEREMEEPFSNGLMYPGQSGAPAEEVINCHCYLDEKLVLW